MFFFRLSDKDWPDSFCNQNSWSRAPKVTRILRSCMSFYNLWKCTLISDDCLKEERFVGEAISMIGREERVMREGQEQAVLLCAPEIWTICFVC